MSDFDNRDMNVKPSQINVTAVWLILAIIILFTIVFILGYSFLTGTTVLKDKELTIWSMLIAAAISCVLGAITSHLSQKSEVNRDRNIVQGVTFVVAENSKKIKDEINVAMKRSDLVSGDREDILRLLINHSLLIGEIKRIMILAHDSAASSKFFTEHFKDALFKNKEFKCKELEILIHDQNIGPEHEIIKKWENFYKNKTIITMRIRRASERSKSFFGMVIEFEGHHSIGLIGFYEPQDEDNGNNVSIINNPYGVFSEEGSSILSVLGKYFNHYWSDAFSLLEKTKTPQE